MIDLEELKRRYEQRDVNYMAEADFMEAVTIQFPAILAKLEAAQRLRDAIAAQHCNGACVGNGKSILVRNALAAFDKEQQ